MSTAPVSGVTQGFASPLTNQTSKSSADTATLAQQSGRSQPGGNANGAAATGATPNDGQGQKTRPVANSHGHITGRVINTKA